MNKKWIVENSESLLDTRWVKVRKDTVNLPNGTHIDDFYAITINDASAIVALDEDQNIILKKEYRYCYEKELLEIPAGTFEENETDSLAVAKRELLEETGYSSNDWTYIGDTIESSSKLTNHMHIYFANNCKKVSLPHLDETEILDVIKIPLEEAVEKVMNNEICCNSSSFGILWVDRKLRKE